MQRAADKAAIIEARRHEQKAALGREPPAGSPGCVVVRVRLPDGSNHQRRFLSADPLQVRLSTKGRGLHASRVSHSLQLGGMEISLQNPVGAVGDNSRGARRFDDLGRCI